MKITIDTTNKTITLLENITIKDFIDNIKILSSCEDFDNYTIINNEKFTATRIANLNPWIDPIYPIYKEPYTTSC